MEELLAEQVVKSHTQNKYFNYNNTVGCYDIYVELSKSEKSYMKAIGLWGISRIMIDERKKILISALNCSLEHSNIYSESFSYIYSDLAVLVKKDTISASTGRVYNKRQLYIEALKCDPTRKNIKETLMLSANCTEPWSISAHMLNLYCGLTNKLIATLFLCIQKLEEQGLIDLAHQAMFEDMLSFFLEKDNMDLVIIEQSIWQLK